MTFKIEYSIETEIIDEEEIEVLSIEAYTDYPNEPIKITLEDASSFGTQTDNQGIGRCNTSEIKDYHVIVEIHDETFEEDIVILKD